MDVELVEHAPGRGQTGIGRFTREIARSVEPHVRVRITTTIDPPLAGRLPVLHSFPAAIAQHQPSSVVHFPQIMGCSLMLWRPYRPAVATVHDLGVVVCPEDRPLHTPLSRFVLNVQLAGLRRMDRFAVNSDYTRDGLVRHLGIAADRIHFVQLGVDGTTFRPMPDARERLAARYGVPFEDGVATLTYTGTELPRKNLPCLLEAMARLKRNGYRTRLLKVGGAGGDRWRAHFLEHVARLGLHDDVVLAGSVPEEDLPRFYSAADMAVTATLLEGGFAWVVMESLACGRPAVATTAAHVPEVARAAVRVVPPRDADALAQAIAALIDDPAGREAMGAAGPGIVAPFSWEATGEAMAAVYRRVAPGRAATPDAA